MKKGYSAIIAVFLLVSVLSFWPTSSSVVAAAASPKLADGTYTLKYNILKAENDSVSMANDYFEKPAKLYVKKGQMTMQIKLNHSEWTTGFKVDYKGKIIDTKVIHKDAKTDTRTVQFPITSVNSPLISKIHVTVPAYNYDHDYTIRFAFDSKSVKKVAAVQSAKSTKSSKK
ncbi:heme uptake protein IsdC [Paenibacillus polymyxa]|uniref:heme uptake protein IsdC n=1 Tax=Paenibacillus TaxID=44249 RepID=UPI002AB4A764|nr:heme uptake protein IsdC [Paenibacillus polymyxa]MDY8023541.1 heme uptake protein IsdC [Paenibacillus polymyxa]